MSMHNMQFLTNFSVKRNFSLTSITSASTIISFWYRYDFKKKKLVLDNLTGALESNRRCKTGGDFGHQFISDNLEMSALSTAYKKLYFCNIIYYM